MAEKGKKGGQLYKILFFVAFIIIISLAIVELPSILTGKKVNKSGNIEKAPLFTVKSLNYPGKVLSVKNYRGKILLINFWATWCPPCRGEIPRLEKFYKAHKKDGFRIIALSVNNQGRKFVVKFVKDFKGGIISYPVAMATYPIELNYGNIYEIPQTFIIDKKGDIVAHLTGEIPRGYLSYEFNKLNNSK